MSRFQFSRRTLLAAVAIGAALWVADTDFSQTKHLDRWHEQDVLFTFGFKVVVVPLYMAPSIMRQR